MCKHCENLVEDKELVHRFFEVAAIRLNEMLPKRIGKPLHRPVTADDIQPVTIKVNAVFWNENPFNHTPAAEHVHRMLLEMDDSGYYLSQQNRMNAPITEEQTENLRRELEKIKSNDA